MNAAAARRSASEGVGARGGWTADKRGLPEALASTSEISGGGGPGTGEDGATAGGTNLLNAGESNDDEMWSTSIISAFGGGASRAPG